jgi:hypothetical protein
MHVYNTREIPTEEAKNSNLPLSRLGKSGFFLDTTGSLMEGEDWSKIIS